jgi:hypothetical protein
MFVRCRVRTLVLALLVGTFFGDRPARAGNEANFVLYDHHTDAKGTTEINVLNDFSSAAPGDPPYAAQLIEMERALTDQWMAALYIEGDKIDGTDYAFGGWRLESRYRLLPYGAFLNPVLYVEYADLRPAHRYLLEVVGRTDTPETAASSEIESRVILGEDIGDKLDVAFNWINDANLSSGNWEFGYAVGLNYALFERTETVRASDWNLKELKLGAELYGGAGDSALGLTLDPNVTQHYAELNLRSEFGNGLHVQVGGAAGLTHDSERGLVRLMLGYEFE